jgi:Domain of unknown function (DUF4169)
MGEVVNLRLARKAKARTEKDKKADQNRLLFGENKASRAARKAESTKVHKLLDGGKLTPDKPGAE